MPYPLKAQRKTLPKGAGLWASLAAHAGNLGST